MFFIKPNSIEYSMTEVFCKALSEEDMYDLLHMFDWDWESVAFHKIELFIEYLLSISFSGKKKLHSSEQREKNHQNKKKYELKPKRKFSLSGNRSFVV